MVSENLHAVYWLYDGASTSDPLSDALDISQLQDTKHAFGFVWHNEAPTTTPPTAQLRRINGATQELQPEGIAELSARPELGYPSSQHPGGVNVAFCDGHVMFLNENVENRVYGQLMTSNRKRSKLFVGAVTDRKLPQPADDEL